MSPRARVAAVFTLALLDASCALGGRLRFEPPVVELTDVRITGLGLSGGALTLLLDISNPNGYELRATRFVASLELENTHFGSAVLEQPTVLPSGARAEVEVPVTFTWEGVGAGARGLLASGAVQYALDMKIDLGTPVGERTVAVRNAGLVPLKELVR